MDIEGWVLAVAAAVATAGGILLVGHRESIAVQNAAALRAFMGPAGQQAARNSTPSRIALVEAMGEVLGVAIFAVVVVGIFSDRSRLSSPATWLPSSTSTARTAQIGRSRSIAVGTTPPPRASSHYGARSSHITGLATTVNRRSSTANRSGAPASVGQTDTD